MFRAKIIRSNWFEYILCVYLFGVYGLSSVTGGCTIKFLELWVLASNAVTGKQTWRNVFRVNETRTKDKWDGLLEPQEGSKQRWPFWPDRRLKTLRPIQLQEKSKISANQLAWTSFNILKVTGSKGLHHVYFGPKYEAVKEAACMCAGWNLRPLQPRTCIIGQTDGTRAVRVHAPYIRTRRHRQDFPGWLQMLF